MYLPITSKTFAVVGKLWVVAQLCRTHSSPLSEEAVESIPGLFTLSITVLRLQNNLNTASIQLHILADYHWPSQIIRHGRQLHCFSFVDFGLCCAPHLLLHLRHKKYRPFFDLFVPLHLRTISVAPAVFRLSHHIRCLNHQRTKHYEALAILSTAAE